MLLSLLATLAPSAFACGGFFPPPSDYAVSDAQEVIFTPGAGEVRVDYRVLVDTDATSFGWVIPIPGHFLSMADGDGHDFTAIHEATNPLEEIEAQDSGGGCMGAMKSDYSLGGGAGDTGGIDIVASGFTGTYSYVVLDATSADALNGWFADNGFDIGPSAPAIAEFVGEGTWEWVAIRLEGELDDQKVEAPPVSIVYGGDRIQYPGRISRYSQAEIQHTIIYVKGDERARLSDGWYEEELPLIWDEGETSQYLIDEAFPENLLELGKLRTYAVLYAGPYEDAWVTRFETRAPSNVHLSDPVFTVDGGTESMHTLISNKGGCDKPEGAEALLLPVAGLAFLLRRKR